MVIFCYSVVIPEGPSDLCLKVFSVESNTLVEIRGKSLPCSLLICPVSYKVHTLFPN